MQRIDKFLNNLYRDSILNPAELNEMKEEMKTHLLDYIEEAKSRGLTEEEAISEALEHFGGENEIFEEGIEKPKSTIWDKWFITSMILLCSSLLLVSLVWGIGQLHQQQRHSFFKGIEGALYMAEMPDIESIKKEVTRAKEESVIKDVVITNGTHSSSPILFQTIGTEGFPQDDSFLIETREERIPTAHPNKEETYLVIHSFNVLRYEPVFQLAAILFIGFLVTFIRFKTRRSLIVR